MLARFRPHGRLIKATDKQNAGNEEKIPYLKSRGVYSDSKPLHTPSTHKLHSFFTEGLVAWLEIKT